MRTTARRTLSAIVAATLATASVLAAAPAASAAPEADTTPPVVTFTWPYNGIVYGQAGGFFSPTASDENGIVAWTVYIDEVVYFTSTSSTILTMWVPIGRLANGPHTIRVTATDPSGNVGTSAPLAITIDRATTVTDIIRPAEGSWVGDSMDIEFVSDQNLKTWEIAVDGSLYWTAGGFSRTTVPYPISGWVDGSAHTVAVTGTDYVGRTSTVTHTVYADAAPPVVGIGAVPSTVAAATVLTGTASDSGSGVTSVMLAFAEREGGDCTSTSGFGVMATLDGSNWSAPMPPTAADGDFCLTAMATDGVGRTSTTTVPVTVDVAGPDAPTGLAPVGEFVTPQTVLTWDAAADAVSYEYRVASDASSLEATAPIAVPGTTATLAAPPAASWVWQVRGIDEHGNAGPWTASSQVTVVAAPELDACSGSCGIIVSTLGLNWGAVPFAVSYRVQVTGTDADGDTVLYEESIDGALTDATITLPADFPTGSAAARVRAELDHEVGGSTVTDWSEPLRFLRFAAPGMPTLLGPSSSAYLAGDEVQLSWTDDPSVVLWELRISSNSTLGADGGLDPDGADSGLPLIDPMFLAIMFVAQPEGVPDGVQLADLDALADCELLSELIDEFSDEDDFPAWCADGSFRIPDTVPDGTYFWQVRGIGFDALLESAEPGRWSDVGRFTVGEAPVIVTPGGSAPHGTTQRTPVMTETVDEPVDEPTDESDSGEPDSGDADAGSDASGSDEGGSDEGGSDEGAPDAETSAAEDSVLGWVIGGIVALIVLGGGSGLVVYLLRRR